MTASPHFVLPLELGICVADLERMAAFYVRVLGCAEVARAQLPGDRTSVIGLSSTDVTIAWLQTSTGERIKLLQPDLAPAGRTTAVPLTSATGIAYLTFYVDDLAARAEAALDAGATPLTDAVVHASGTGAIAFFRDPEGNVIELVERADLRAYRADAWQQRGPLGPTP